MGLLTELDAQGPKLKTNVYLGGQVLARQEPNWIVWEHSNPLTGSRGRSNRDGGYSTDSEPDPTGVDLGAFDPYIQPELWEPPAEGVVGLFAGTGVPSGRCTMDGMAMDCEEAIHRLEMGTAWYDSEATLTYVDDTGKRRTIRERTGLPPGIDVRAKGKLADYAWIAFNWGNDIGGSFDWGLIRAIDLITGARNSEGLSGYAAFAYSFAPQNTSGQSHDPSILRGQVLNPCLNININNRSYPGIVDIVKGLIFDTFANAGVGVVFNNPKAVRAGNSFTLNIAPQFPPNVLTYVLRDYPNGAFGTTLTVNGRVQNEGWVSTDYIDKWLGGFNLATFGIAGGVGAHETTHWFLQAGHNASGQGLMREGNSYRSSSDWKFTKDQLRQLKRRCP